MKNKEILYADEKIIEKKQDPLSLTVIISSVVLIIVLVTLCVLMFVNM